MSAVESHQEGASQVANPITRLGEAITSRTLGWFGGRTKALGENIPPALADSFRLLALEIQRTSANLPLQTLLVMGAYRGDGRTFTVAHLGIALARLGSRVILVDSDLRRPRLAQLFKAESAWADAKQTKAPLPLTITSTHIPGVALVPAESLEQAWSDAIALSELLSALQPFANYIILDSPPCMEYGDAFFLAPQVDGVIFVVRRRQQDVNAIRTIQTRLARLGVHVVGAVYNDKG